jgi:hypothetical protein
MLVQMIGSIAGLKGKHRVLTELDASLCSIREKKLSLQILGGVFYSHGRLVCFDLSNCIGTRFDLLISSEENTEEENEE